MARSSPDFKRATIETVGKRAAYLCSNPDCRISTIGPNTNQEAATIIGEAAHIFGARPGSRRYRADMTDAARASITNAIWLCRNCHKRVDADEKHFSVDVLYTWLDKHDEYCSLQLGNATDKIRFDQARSETSPFRSYPALIRRIVVDRPEDWEWRLTAELLRHLTEPHLRKIRDLRDGLYIKPLVHVDSDNMHTWFRHRLAEMSTLIAPMPELGNRLTRSWGKPGQAGDIEEIHHVCKLIRDIVDQVVAFEESIRFTNVPEPYKAAVSTLHGVIGAQIEKIVEIPIFLDEVVSLFNEDTEDDSGETRVIKRTIVFDLPPGWEKKIEDQIKRANRTASGSVGCLAIVCSVTLSVVFMVIIV